MPHLHLLKEAAHGVTLSASFKPMRTIRCASCFPGAPVTMITYISLMILANVVAIKKASSEMHMAWLVRCNLANSGLSLPPIVATASTAMLRAMKISGFGISE